MYTIKYDKSGDFSHLKQANKVLYVSLHKNMRFAGYLDYKPFTDL